MISKLITGRYLEFPNINVPPVQNLRENLEHFVFVDNQPFKIERSRHVGQRFKDRIKVSTVSRGRDENKAHRNFQWLPWIEGEISCVPITDTTIFTGPMTGCWMTIFMFEEIRYVGHIGTSGNFPELTVQVQEAWRNAVNNGQINSLCAFNPTDPNFLNINELNTQNYGLSFYGMFGSDESAHTVVLGRPKVGEMLRIMEIIPMETRVDVDAF